MSGDICQLSGGSLPPALRLFLRGCAATGRASQIAAPSQLLLEAAGLNQVDQVLHLLEEGADVETADEACIVPECLAGQCLDCGLWTVLWTLPLTVPASVPLQAGRTPLHWACQRGHTGVAELLLQKGAKVDAADKVWCCCCVDASSLAPSGCCLRCVPGSCCMWQVWGFATGCGGSGCML